MARVAALEQEEPGGVDADVGDELVERDDVAGPLGHLGPLATLDQMDQLQNPGLEPDVLFAERADGGVHAGDVTVVVGAQHVEQPHMASLDLVGMVGNVCTEVGRLAP